MNNRNIVVTVRLSDVHEIDQPDPICLPADELATWRHFEALLQSMYKDPPPAIRVCYLDDESDWIEVSSDSELREAIRIAQTTDEILQLQVKRRDALQDVYIESTLSTTPASVRVENEDPHVTPLQTTYYNDSGRQEQRLVYPHPPSSNVPPSPTWRCVYPLVYPHPNQSSGDGATATVENCTKNNENVLMLEANGRSACIQNRPDLSTDEKIKRLKARLSNHKEGEDEKLKGLNTCLSFREMFHQASGYTSEDKIKFMKKIVTGEQSNDKPKNEGSEDTNISQGEHNKNKHELLIEPLAATDASTTQAPVKPPSPTSLAVQDPFEVVCHDQPSRDLEQIQLNLQPGNILEPEKPRDSSPPKESDSVVMVDEVPIVPANRSVVNTRPSSSVQAAPIPLLYTLQMMDGAQSGANAVAIEIPEGDHHGAAQKEEDATASGGTACTSASAETGEVIGTGSCQDGAAVGDKVKDRTVNRQSSCNGDYAMAQHAGGVAGTKKSKRSKDASPLKAAVKDTEKSKKKESSSKEAKKVEKKHAKAACCHHKATKEKGSCGDVKIEADVESGEKIVKKKKSKHAGLLHTTDFVKMMTKMQSELHSGIVKDVKEQTGKLLKKTLLRSTSFESAMSLTFDRDQIFEDVFHKGIYCDSCNCTINGIRYKCGNCADFDFCEKCEASNNGHDPSHVFLKLCRPAPMAGKVGVENIPLLRDIVYKENEDSTEEHARATKIERLEDVPILSISEVTTPGEKHSPPSTPSDSHKKADINNWVWDSTFDTDKHLYSLDGECTGRGGHTQTTAALSPESMGNSHQRLSDSEMKRLYALLSIEAEAAKRANNNNGEEHGHDLIVEIPKLTSVPELAESVHSISTLPSTNAAIVDLDVDQSPLMPSTRTKVEETSSMGVTIDREASFGKVETSVDKDVLDVGDEPKVETDKDEDCYSQASSAELVDVDEEEEEEDEGEAFEELDVDGEDDGNNNGEESQDENQRKVTTLDHHFDSDTSDDFCVLDPPSRSDMVEEEQEAANVEAIERTLLHHTTDVPSMEIVDHVRAEGEAVSLASNTNSSADQIQDQNCIVEVVPVVEEIKAVNVAKEESTAIVVEDQRLDNDDTVDGDHKEGAEASGGNGEVNEENQENVVRDAFQIDNVDDDDIFLKMTAEEKKHFQKMITSLRERAQDLENELKIRKEAEAEMKVEKEMEKKYQMILEEKQKEAVRENEKLEQFQKKKEQEEKLKRQQRLMEKEKERKLRQKKSKELKAGSGGGSACGEGAKRKSRMSSLGTKPTLMQMALNGKEGRLTKKTEKQESGLTPTSSSSLSGQGKAAPSVQVDNVIYVQSGKKDVDCQTNGRGVGGTDAAAQASQMIQHVASGVSKAAEAAFHTAKDVFYSLQAKQVEKKTYEGVVYTKTTPINSKASSTDAETTTTTTTTAATITQEPTLAGQEEQKTTWTPPTLIWTPPADTFVPPKSEWTPPASDWKPPNVNWIPPKSEWTGPKSEWTGPKSEWTPPKGYYQPPGLEPEPEVTSSTSTATETQNQQSDDGKQDKSKKVEKSTRHEETSNTTNLSSSSSSSVSSVTLPPLPPIQITDPILRREVQGMQLLIEMGFANREQNRKLLQEFDGDVEKVVQSLLQEEREEHWSWQRH